MKATAINEPRPASHKGSPFCFLFSDGAIRQSTVTKPANGLHIVLELKGSPPG